MVAGARVVKHFQRGAKLLTWNDRTRSIAVPEFAKKFRHLLRLFALALTATDAAHPTGLTHKSVTAIFLEIRIRGRVAPEVVIQSNGWRGYDGLVDVGYAKHFRVHHGQDEFVRGNSHVNGIESFRSYAESRLHQFHGIIPEKFYLHLKECEHRFNLRKNHACAELLKLPRKYPL